MNNSSEELWKQFDEKFVKGLNWDNEEDRYNLEELVNIKSFIQKHFIERKKLKKSIEKLYEIGHATESYEIALRDMLQLLEEE